MMTPGSGNLPPSGSTASAPVSTNLYAQSIQGLSTALNHPFNPSANSQPISGVLNGQQNDGSSLLRNPTAPAPAIGLTSPTAQPRGGIIMQSGLVSITTPLPALSTPVTTQLAAGKDPGDVHIGSATTSSFTLTTRMTGCGNSNSVFSHITPSLLVPMGPAVPTNAGNLGLGVPTRGSSSSFRVHNFVSGLKGKVSIIPVPSFSQKTQGPSKHSMTATPGGPSGQ
jgi:hypothetical protein